MKLNISNISANLNKLQEDPTLKQFFTDLSKCGPSLILGGAVRDWSIGNAPRDIDIVVDCHKDKLSFLSKYRGQKNKFDGYKLKVGSIEFDIWALDTTWALKNDAKFKKSLSIIPETVFLNVDAVGYRLDTQEIYENGFRQTMASRQLDIMYEPNPYPFLCASKALCALVKYDLEASANLKRYVSEQRSRGYNKKSFDKYNETLSLNFNYEECIQKCSI